MKKQTAVALFNGVNACGNLVGKKFGYFLARNLQLLKPLMEEVEESRKALIENYAKKVDGKPEIVDNNYIFEDKEAFESEYKKLMAEEIDVKIYTIKLEEVPDTITAQQLNGIYELITE